MNQKYEPIRAKEMYVGTQGEMRVVKKESEDLQSGKVTVTAQNVIYGSELNEKIQALDDKVQLLESNLTQTAERIERKMDRILEL